MKRRIDKSRVDKKILHLIGVNIAKARKSLTQQELADLSGISRSRISNIEQGKISTQIHELYRIASSLKLTSINDILPDFSKIYSVEIPKEDLLKCKDLDWLEKVLKTKIDS